MSPIHHSNLIRSTQTMTTIETLEDKAERLNKRLNETDPASDNYNDLLEELEMLDREIELEMALILEDEEFFANNPDQS